MEETYTSIWKFVDNSWENKKAFLFSPENQKIIQKAYDEGLKTIKVYQSGTTKSYKLYDGFMSIDFSKKTVSGKSFNYYTLINEVFGFSDESGKITLYNYENNKHIQHFKNEPYGDFISLDYKNNDKIEDHRYYLRYDNIYIGNRLYGNSLKREVINNEIKFIY